MAYGNGNGAGSPTYGNGGGSPTSDNVLNLTNAEFSDDLRFVDSEYNFTDPPRYFKANDPYYFEVDNIPLKQLQENCLWLRDQIAGKDLDVTGISTRKITDLQPYTSNADRVVNVRPGKFTARVNDAYSNRNSVWENFLADSANSVDINSSPIYNPASLSIDDSAFSILVGQTVTQLMYNNGLYDHFQTHAADVQKPVVNTSTVGGPLSLQFTTTRQYLPGGDNASNLPKVRTAIWKQLVNNSPAISSNLRPDLQQLSVDFCRRWNGIFRTAVVNVPNSLSIQVPVFDENDYLDNDTVYDPQVRIDLIFMYTHPVDSTSTTTTPINSATPNTITTPQLGLVRGAGSILTANNALDISENPQFIGNDLWTQQAGQSDAYYDTSQNKSDGASLSIQAPLADQPLGGQETVPFPGKATGNSFPSPDDLLNLAPIISQNAVEIEFSLIGQSVLPLCYVVVKKDSPIITDLDIIDIRPFLRTTELTYNERSGVAAANPPLSLANPATGKSELYTAVETVRDYGDAKLELLRNEIQGLIDSVPIAQPVCALQFRSENYVNEQNLTIVEQRTQNNGDEDHSVNYLANAPSYWSDVAGGRTFQQVATGATSVNLIPGKYLIEGTITSIDKDFQGATNVDWTVTLRDDTTAIYPNTSDNVLALSCFRGGQGSSRNTEVNGSVAFSTILTVGENAQDVDTATTSFGITLSRSGGSATPNFTAGVTLTRVANTDGSPGLIRAV